jgi:hypothetical protein
MSDEYPLNLVNLPWTEAMRLDKRFNEGAPDGVEFFADLRAGKGRCFICDAEMEDDAGVISIMPEPTRIGVALLGRQCEACGSLTWQQRANRIIKLFKAMRPGWHVTRDSSRPVIARR